jgi:pilus assembly protein FimV
MILTCNECGIGFNFDENLLKETGSKVRCSKCKNVFTAYPPSSASQSEKTDFAMEDEQSDAPGTESSPETSNDDGIELKNIDLSEIEGILDMDNEPDSGSDSPKGPGELDFDFTTEKDEGETTLESTLESEKTEELDLSEMDNILKEDESPEETLSLDLSDMENILESEDEAAKESESSQEEDPGFELGLDLDTGEDQGEATLESTLESEKTEELDLFEMDNILKEDKEPETKSVSTDETIGLDLDFDTGEIEDEAALESALGLEKTEELDLSEMDNILKEGEELETKSLPTDENTGLDLDFDIDESLDEDRSDFEPDETVALDLSDMDNILEVKDEPSEETESSEEEDFDFELDFGSDKEEVVSASEPVAESEKKEDLDISDFENILEEDQEPETKSVSTDEILDFDIDESSDEDGSDFELEETVELDLSDMDNVLEIEDEESKNTESAADEDLDFELDLDFEDEKGQDDKTLESTAVEAEMPDDLDFELNLDMDEDEGADSDKSELKPELELEDIEGLDLSDMEDGISEIDKQATEDPYDEKTDEIDLDLDMVEEEGEDTDNDSLAVELGDAEEFDLSDLDSVLDQEDNQAGRDVPTEELEELELDLVIEDDIADASDDNASEIQFKSTEKFDLSDINNMIDTDEKPKMQDAESEEVELDFEIEGNAQDLLVKDKTIEEQTDSHKKEKLDDTFDMGAIEDGSDAEDVDGFTDSKKAKTYPPKRKPAGKKQLSGLMRILLIFVLLFGGAYAAHEVLNSMGIKISVTDAFRDIPFVGDLLKPDVKDVGNIYVNIFEKTVNGKFVDNPKIGTLFVVTGKIQNEYKHSRRFIKMTGKIYKKGKALVKAETVYCGNLLSEAELKSLNQVAITKRLKNRFGDKKINMNVKKGQTLPFMIVFSNVPSGLEEYSVQVAGSDKS